MHWVQEITTSRARNKQRACFQHFRFLRRRRLASMVATESATSRQPELSHTCSTSTQ